MVDSRQSVFLAVCGAHLDGQPLNGDLLALGAVLVEATSTAPVYRMVALPGAVPRPGLIRAAAGASVEVEVYRLPVAGLGALTASLSSPLAIGSVLLADGRSVQGFVCEGYAAATATDITTFGGWRRYLDAAVG